MRPNQIRLLRRALVGLIVVLVAAVGFNYLHTLRRRAQIVRQASRLLDPDLARSADSIEYSENEGGVPRFKVRATTVWPLWVWIKSKTISHNDLPQIALWL